MMDDHRITTHEIGHLCIYLTRNDHLPPQRWWQHIFPRSLSHEIIQAAKQNGILNATAHSPLHGFTGKGAIEQDHPEYSSPRLSIFVELVAERLKLEEFVLSHGALLADKIIVYKHIERWRVDNSHIQSHEIDTPEL